MTNETTTAGPAPGRPSAGSAWVIQPWMKLMTGVVSDDAPASPRSPAAAVPVSAKMPEPMIAPTPRAVRSRAESERFMCRSGASASWMSLSGLLVRKIRDESTRGVCPFPAGRSTPEWTGEEVFSAGPAAVHPRTDVGRLLTEVSGGDG